MGNRIETMDRARSRMLIGFLIGYLAWQVPTIARNVFGTTLSKGVAAGLALIAVLGSILWIVYLFRMLLLGRRLRLEPVVAAALDDERVREVRRRSLAMGFWALLVFQAFILLLSLAHSLDSAVVAQSGLVVGVVVVIGSFLLLDRTPDGCQS